MLIRFQAKHYEPQANWFYAFMMYPLRCFLIWYSSNGCLSASYFSRSSPICTIGNDIQILMNQQEDADFIIFLASFASINEPLDCHKDKVFFKFTNYQKLIRSAFDSIFFDRSPAIRIKRKSLLLKKLQHLQTLLNSIRFEHKCEWST